MPYSRSLRLPSSLIQSVVHAGAQLVLMRTGPSGCNAASTAASIASVAGQPL